MNNQRNNSELDNHYTDELITQNNNSVGYSRVPQTEDQNTQNQPGLFSRFIIRPLAYIGSFFCSK